MVVVRAVENPGDGAVYIEHRLLAGRDVDNRQPTHAERNAGSLPKPRRIRTAMLQGRDHSLQNGGIMRAREPGYSTHRLITGPMIAAKPCLQLLSCAAGYCLLEA